MSTTLLAHVIAGSIGLLAGFTALYAAKGARLHRRSGLLFVWSISLMGVSGAVIAALESTEISVIAGLTTAYLAVTGYNAVRPPTDRTRRIDIMLMVVGMVIGATALVLGIHTLGAPGGTRDGLPAFPFFIMGLPAFFGALADVKMLRQGVPKGVPRIVRHLWRVSYALLIASMSFFLGQADEIPEPLRITAVLVTLAFLPALTMLYWLWRVRIRRSLRGLMSAATPEPV